jgi:hypothetical protein
MDHNSPNQNLNTPSTNSPSLSPTSPPSVQPPPEQARQPQEESSTEFSRGKKVLIWVICNIVLGALPVIALVIYAQLHSELSTFPALLAKGDLIAFSMAIFSEALGHTYLRNMAKPKSYFGLNAIRFFGTIFALLLAFGVLISLLPLANCYELHPHDASACTFLVISDSNIFVWSVVLCASSIVLGLIAKATEI